jgi:beta-lactam-binding protein with PASTA domain
VVSIPRVIVGETCPVAVAQLKHRGVNATCPAAQRLYSNVVPVNRVARVLYGKTVNPLAVPSGASVVLERSKGPNTSTTTTTSGTGTTTTSTTTTTQPATEVAVPDVVGDTYSQAYAAMKTAVLYFTTTGSGAGTTTWTDVVSQSPAAGTMVPTKSTVTLNVK